LTVCPNLWSLLLLNVAEAIKSVDIGVANLVIKETGRTKKEIGFALILDGIY